MSNNSLIANKRIMKEYKECNESQEYNFDVKLINNTFNNWHLIFEGPNDTLYQNGKFKLSIKFGNEYPFIPPNIRFITRILHPNISLDGEICLDILKYNWSPALSLVKVILSIISLLSDPNTKSPLNNDAAKLYDNDIDEYNKSVIYYVEKYAIDY